MATISKLVVDSIKTEEGKKIISSWFKTKGEDVSFVEDVKGNIHIQTTGYSSIDGTTYSKNSWKTNTVSINGEKIIVYPFFTWVSKYVKKKKSKWIEYDFTSSGYRSDRKSDMFDVDYDGDWKSNSVGDAFKSILDLMNDYDLVYTKKDDITDELKGFLLEIPAIMRNSKIDKVLDGRGN